MSRYDDDLDRRQREHLRKVRENQERRARDKPCLHDACSECVGTGIKLDGSACVHMISCPCPKHVASYL